MLSYKDLEAARLTVEVYLPDTCNIFRPATVDNGAGGYTTTYPATPDNTSPCEVRSKLATEQVSAGKFRQVSVYDIVLPYDSDVRTGDRIVSSGRTFEVSGVSGDQTNGTEIVADVYVR